MGKLKKYKAIVMITIIFLIQIIMIESYAIGEGTNRKNPISEFSVYKGTVKLDYYDMVNNISFIPQNIVGDGWTHYCLQKGAHYNATMPKDDAVEGKIVEKEEGEGAPIGGNTMVYRLKGQIDTTKYQDLAYVIASAAEKNMLHDKETQLSIWASSINTIINQGDKLSNKGLWGEEATKFQNFYSEVHMWNEDSSSYTDVYTSKVKEYDTNKTICIDYSSKNYIIGPYKITYPQGNFNEQIWSYISAISILDQDNKEIGKLSIEDIANDSKAKGNIEIVDANGNPIKDLKENNFPETDAEFYIKFNWDLMPKDEQGASEVTSIRVKVQFTYLESCSGIMYEYIGTSYDWFWVDITPPTVIPPKRKYKSEYVEHLHYVTQPDGVIPYGEYIDIYEDEDGKIIPGKVTINYGWDNEEDGEIIASKKWKTTSVIMGNSKTDMTMNIEGYTFLDQESGKVNEVDNIKQDQEALSGVEVKLYYADGDNKDQLVNKTNDIVTYHKHIPECYQNVPHTHVGSPLTGGGCYTHRTNHTHDGTPEDGGACYSEAITHTHIGSPTPVETIHHHTEDCGEGQKTCVVTCEIERKENGQLWFWEVHSSGGKCGQINEEMNYGHPDRNVIHIGTNQYWLDNEHPELKDWESRSRECIKYSGDGCGLEEGQTIYVGSGCYHKPVYHIHTDDCYGGGHTHIPSCYGSGTYGKAEDGCTSGDYGWQNSIKCPHGYTYNKAEKPATLICGKEETSKETTCGYEEGQIERFDVSCGQDGKVYGYILTCKEPMFDTKNCTKDHDEVLKCGKSVIDEEGRAKVQIENATITGKDGHYEFIGLDPMRKYYVKFVYNGMLYTNVQTFVSGKNENNDSKADETSRYDYRTPFNNKFAEIGSYPANYTIVNKIFGEELGDTNKVYLQKDIVNIFKKMSEKMKNKHTDNCVVAAKELYSELERDYINKKGEISEEAQIELKRKIQFAADCRIESQTVKNYPLTDKFTISTVGKTINSKSYYPIYGGDYDQLHVNLGIKARSAFDMKLDKNVRKVEVNINGKSEIYNYNPDTNISTPRVGITETDYKNGMRQAYLENNADFIDSKDTTYQIARNDLEIYARPEEITNGTLDNTTDTSIASSYNLSNEDKLKILITYRIKLENQASIKGTVTEIVDYYDTNFNFVKAYFGTEDGIERNDLGTIDSNDNSKYASTEKRATRNGYKTIYLQPKRVKNEEVEYIYVTFELNNASELLTTELILNNKEKLSTMNLAEINGYKTDEGLIDIDSIPGNFNITDIDNLNNIVQYKKEHPELLYEDDAERAQALVFKRQESRTVEGTVFEDIFGELGVKVGELDTKDIGIAGVIVELVEIKNDKMVVRATTKTNQNGWYGFTGFIPGDYVIRYTYGADNDTSLSKESAFEKGLNDKSYNGQDYVSTTYAIKGDKTEIKPNTDDTLIKKYIDNNNVKNGEESVVQITNKMTLDKHTTYWYTIQDSKSDAKDYEYRTNQVKEYSKNEYGTEITNHKAEVFNSYVNPQPEHINNSDANKELVNELQRRTYKYAYTPVMEVEVEYATKVTEGNRKYDHKILGIDFGVIERPKSELTIDQDVKHIKVTLADGRVLFDTQTGTDNLQWINKGDINKYDKNELINIIMDEELINGATLEIEYNLTVTNNSQKNTGTTSAKTILNYVANNLNYDENDTIEIDGKSYRNGELWKVVPKEEIQKDSKSSFVNNQVVDLSTQSIILQTTENNPLTKAIESGEQTKAILKLRKVLSSESSTDDLTYSNMTEIVEIDNTIGRYDHLATPGNQKLEEQPREHDTSGASKYVTFDDEGQPNNDYPPDGVIIVTPPTGSTYIYYGVGIIGTLMLMIGIFLIKKFVIDKKK